MGYGATAIVMYDGPPKPHSWARWMVNRVLTKNQNNLVAVVGKTGSGKSYAAMAICEIMSKMDGIPFSADHIVFSLTDLMRLINSGKLKRGDKIIFDEPQVSISAREFQSQANKVFNYLVSTFRHRNLTLFFCTPSDDLLDKNTRRLFHVRMETKGINFQKKLCRLFPRYLDFPSRGGPPYVKRLIVGARTPDGIFHRHKITFWDVPKPSPELIREYEKKKKEFTDTLNRNIQNKLEDLEREGKTFATGMMSSKTKEELEKIKKEKEELQKKIKESDLFNDPIIKHIYMNNIKRSLITLKQFYIAVTYYNLMDSFGNGRLVASIFDMARSSIGSNKQKVLVKGYLIKEFRNPELAKELKELVEPYKDDLIEGKEVKGLKKKVVQLIDKYKSSFVTLNLESPDAFKSVKFLKSLDYSRDELPSTPAEYYKLSPSLTEKFKHSKSSLVQKQTQS